MPRLNSELWTKSIHDLVEITRESFLALVPIMEKARIPWRDNSSYDDWDLIASSLYSSIVTNAIYHSVEYNNDSVLPQYGVASSNIQYRSYILITDRRFDKVPLAFVKFSTKLLPFDHISCQAVAPSYPEIELDSVEVPMKHASISLSLYNEIFNARRDINKLNIIM